jgi:hypothetical protein
MTTQMVLQEKHDPRASWIILAGVTLFTALNGLWVAITPVGSQTELSGRTWNSLPPRSQRWQGYTPWIWFYWA